MTLPKGDPAHTDAPVQPKYSLAQQRRPEIEQDRHEVEPVPRLVDELSELDHGGGRLGSAEVEVLGQAGDLQEAFHRFAPTGEHQFAILVLPFLVVTHDGSEAR